MGMTAKPTVPLAGSPGAAFACASGPSAGAGARGCGVLLLIA